MSKKVVVIGGIPNPIGGVTTFVCRLVCELPSVFTKVLDLYPNKDKTAIPVKHIQLKNKSISLFIECAKNRKQSLFFNFSNTRSLLLLALLPKLGSRWGLILHNGNLRDSHHIPFFNFLTRVAIKKADVIGVLSDAQESYYLSKGALKSRLLKVQTYIPKARPSIQSIAENLPAKIIEWKESGRRIYVCSGYPTRIYQHLEIIRAFQDLWTNGHNDLRLALFIYGTDSDGILNEISEAVASSEFAHLYKSMNEDAFNATIAIANGYIRMNTVDSFGIAVADAISFGTPTVASNVCNRFPGGKLLDPQDFEAMKEFVLSQNKSSIDKRAPYHGNGLSEFLDALANSQSHKP